MPGSSPLGGHRWSRRANRWTCTGGGPRNVGPHSAPLAARSRPLRQLCPAFDVVISVSMTVVMADQPEPHPAQTRAEAGMTRGEIFVEIRDVRKVYEGSGDSVEALASVSLQVR